LSASERQRLIENFLKNPFLQSPPATRNEFFSGRGLAGFGGIKTFQANRPTLKGGKGLSRENQSLEEKTSTSWRCKMGSFI
jgi:hypothetical protein